MTDHKLTSLLILQILFILLKLLVHVPRARRTTPPPAAAQACPGPGSTHGQA